MKKSEFLKQIRKKHKASRAKFAELLEVSPSSIEKIEREQIPITPENKYVKAVCALEGLDNEIFKYDDITDEVLQKHELSKFSKAFRKFLYFYYGDFWSYEFMKNFLLTYNDFIPFYLIENEINLINYENFDTSFVNFLLKNFSSKINLQNELQKMIKSHLEDKKLNTFFEIISILTINNLINNLIFKPSNFNNINIYIDFLNNKKNIEYLKQYDLFHFEYFINHIENIKSILQSQEKEGQLLTVENIKKLKQISSIVSNLGIDNIIDKFIKETNKSIKELEKIQNEVIPAPTDPKDKQICELLQYAPPAFKDKIIEKLLQYKKDVEEF